MDKGKQFIVWLDGFFEACGSTLNEEQTTIVKNKLDSIFDHSAKDSVEELKVEELGISWVDTPQTNPNVGAGFGDSDVIYRC
jgi:hypothetical protein